MYTVHVQLVELSRGVVCMILGLAILTQYWRVTDGHTMTGNIHASIAKVKIIKSKRICTTHL